MSNLNQRIEPLHGDGIPGYNRKINEVITAVNWLLGVRVTNGRQIRESEQGPVFDLAQINPQPVTPTAQNFQPGQTSGSPPGSNPVLSTIGPQWPPINPPTSVPRIYISTGDAIGSPAGTAPILSVSNGLISIDPPSASFSYIFTITYDGVSIFSISGSGTAYYNLPNFITLGDINSGWKFDPKGVAGYPFGSKQWIYPYNGAASQNTDPQVVESFSYSFIKPMSFVSLPVIFLAA